MNLALVLSIFCCVAVTFGHHWENTNPTTVRCHPAEWEGEVYGEVVLASQPVSAVGFMGNVSYSFSRQMEYSESVSSVAGVDYHTKAYKDWKQGYEYEYNVKTGACRILRKLSGGMKRYCENSNEIKFLRSFMIGDKMADLVETAQPGAGITKAYTTVLRDSQVPVMMIATIDYAGTTQYVALQYANVRTGLSNSGVFTLPQTCRACTPHGSNPFGRR